MAGRSRRSANGIAGRRARRVRHERARSLVDDQRDAERPAASSAARCPDVGNAASLGTALGPARPPPATLAGAGRCLIASASSSRVQMGRSGTAQIEIDDDLGDATKAALIGGPPLQSTRAGSGYK